MKKDLEKIIDRIKKSFPAKTDLLIDKREGLLIFPFFNHNRTIELFMVLIDGDPDIYLIPYDKAEIKKSFNGSLIMKKPSSLKKFTEFKKNDFFHLYHYDPLWILNNKRFGKHPLKKYLKETNMASEKGKIKSVNYSNDLTKVQGVMIRTGYLNFLKETDIKPFLAIKKRESDNNCLKETGWNLDPVWKDNWSHLNSLR